MSGSSPVPQYVAVERDLGRGVRWYLYVCGWDHSWDEHGRETVTRWVGSRPCGGPYASRREADAEIERRYAEMGALYDEVEARAREEGRTVAW